MLHEKDLVQIQLGFIVKLYMLLTHIFKRIFLIYDITLKNLL